MSTYQVIARRYRPQNFSAIMGQDAIVTTLKNAIRQQRLAHAYLFCGSRGTGKTTLARVFAKALNCLNPSADFEPCNDCSSCRDITAGNSLDVLEIDGASHRGIDDVRQINETVGFASSSGKYKIYLIDEVHMLTKEAFNALLKTLEEPPAKVLFFFATTEPHKVLPTILSRCQRYNLNRIPPDIIIKKLQRIASDQGRSLAEDAARMIANRAEGAFRDAESLLDQIFAFHEGDVSAETITSVLGLMSEESLFIFDQAAKDHNLKVAFELVDQLFSGGKDLAHFIELLTNHYRTLLLIKLSGKDAPFLTLTASEREKYAHSATIYTREQCLTAIELLVEAQSQIRFSPSPRIALEALLLKILQLPQRISIDFLVRRLQELENSLLSGAPIELKEPVKQTPKEIPSPPTPPPPEPPKLVPEPPPSPIEKAIVPPPTAQVITPPPIERSITEDPTPTAADIGGIKKVATANNPPPPAPISMKKQSRYDTLMQFAAVELEGALQNKNIGGK